jgi:GxxExxY protein
MKSKLPLRRYILFFKSITNIMKKLSKAYINALTYQIIGAAIEVHKEMGPGLLEDVYEACFIHELGKRGLQIKCQEQIPVCYKGLKLDAKLRYDLLIEDSIVVELKSVASMLPIFEAQAISYARLLKVPKAILINFNCSHIFSEGQKTFVNQFFNDLPD